MTNVAGLVENAALGESSAGEALAASYEQGFSGSDLLTLGLEEELILVDPVSFEPADEIELVLEHGLGREVRGRVPRLAGRARDAGVARPPPSSRRELAARAGDARRGARRPRAAAGRRHASGLDAAGPRHRPAALPPDRRRLPVGDAGAASRAACTSTSGSAIADEALAIYNAARAYLPELAALGANSPFFEGGDAGLASSRLKLVEDLPRAAIPPGVRLVARARRVRLLGRRRGLFPDLTYLWWDLRPRPDLGTIEFRIADAQTSSSTAPRSSRSASRSSPRFGCGYRASEQLPVIPTHVIAENRWRAVRDGLDGELVDPVTGESEPTRAPDRTAPARARAVRRRARLRRRARAAPGRCSSETAPSASARSPPAAGLRRPARLARRRDRALALRA